MNVTVSATVSPGGDVEVDIAAGDRKATVVFSGDDTILTVPADGGGG